MTGAWTPPQARPIRARYDADTGVVTVPNRFGAEARTIPAPQLAAETLPIRKPAASVAFPTHPAAALDIFAGACAVLAGTGILADSESRRGERIAGDLWSQVDAVFRPGGSIREALDEHTAQTPRWPDSPADASTTVPVPIARDRLLISWAIAQALCAYAAGG